MNYAVGDLVRYIGTTWPAMRGVEGVVEGIHPGGVEVLFNGWADTRHCMRESLEKVTNDVTQEEIDEAYNLLASVGTVMFRRRKPPFKPVLVSGLGSYSAAITADHIRVGCTTISFEKFDEVAAAVAKAREWHEQGDLLVSNYPKETVS